MVRLGVMTLFLWGWLTGSAGAIEVTFTVPAETSADITTAVNDYNARNKTSLDTNGYARHLFIEGVIAQNFLVDADAVDATYQTGTGAAEDNKKTIRDKF